MCSLKATINFNYCKSDVVIQCSELVSNIKIKCGDCKYIIDFICKKLGAKLVAEKIGYYCFTLRLRSLLFSTLALCLLEMSQRPRLCPSKFFPQTRSSGYLCRQLLTLNPS